MKHYLIAPSKLQFEISSMCNALCLGCIRTESSHYNDKKFVIPSGVFLKFETFQKIITAKPFESVIELEFCGTIDDPLMHPEFLDFLRYAVDLKRFRIFIHTNASLRNKSYWKSMAEILRDNPENRVLFSIDGLEDTNHIYRQKTSWKKIIENAEIFLQNGGPGSWQYIVFPWNKHQIDDAKDLSKSLGFKEFSIRHDRSNLTKIGLDLVKFKKNKNINKINFSTLANISEDLKIKIQNNIECNNQNKKMYFISYDSRLWPCCFLHNGMLSSDIGKRNLLKQRLFHSYGSDDWNDCEKHKIEDILAHDFYQRGLVESWTSNHHGVNINDRIFRCTEVCNKETLKCLPIGSAKVLYSKEQNENKS